MKNNKLKLFYIALVLLFLYLPIIVLVVFSFNDSQLNIKWQGFTLKWYSVLFHNKELLTAFINTIIVAVSAMTVSTIIGNYLAENLGWNDFLVTILNMLANFILEYLYDMYVVFKGNIDNKKK